MPEFGAEHYLVIVNITCQSQTPRHTEGKRVSTYDVLHAPCPGRKGLALYFHFTPIIHVWMTPGWGKSV